MSQKEGGTMSNIKTVKLSDVGIGEIFAIGGYEFIKFKEEDGAVTAVCRDSLFDSRYGDNSNFAQSVIREKLEKVLAKIEKLVGAENVLAFETDLISMGGSEMYGKINTKICLPTFDFYRQNRAIFEKHKLFKWWWLATPWETPEPGIDGWVVCVTPSGCIINYGYQYRNGVRPFCIFSSSILVSCEE